jgi:copper homeostasis protein
MRYILEVIAFNIESCMIAEVAGAKRIELCDNPNEGGTTPSYGLIIEARKKTTIDLYPIIRPRGGDFLYSEEEFEIMKSDIRISKELGCDGVVLGLLKSDGTIDKKRTAQLVEIAYPMGVTFHRAFDRTADPFQALEEVIETGCERILTSGLKPQASEGIEMLYSLIQKSDNRIIIMPGSGIRSNNIIDILQTTKATEFHSSARVIKDSEMKHQNKQMNEELKSVILDEQEVIKMASALSGY